MGPRVSEGGGDVQIKPSEEGPETVHILSWWPQNKHGIKTARLKQEWLKERFLSTHFLVTFCYLVSNFLPLLMLSFKNYDNK